MSTRYYQVSNKRLIKPSGKTLESVSKAFEMYDFGCCEHKQTNVICQLRLEFHSKPSFKLYTEFENIFDEEIGWLWEEWLVMLKIECEGGCDYSGSYLIHHNNRSDAVESKQCELPWCAE